MSCQIGDMLTRIRNASMAKHESLICAYSKLKEAILLLMVKEGYIESYEVDDSDSIKKKLCINLKYTTSGKSVINHMRLISKPGRKIYVKGNAIPRSRNGLGIYIVSTSYGLKTDSEILKMQNRVGGKLICEIY